MLNLLNLNLFDDQTVASLFEHTNMQKKLNRAFDFSKTLYSNA